MVSDSLNEYQAIIKNLKTKLKQEGFSYASLAEKMEMSESGVKKMLAGQGISLSKILKVCSIFTCSLIW